MTDTSTTNEFDLPAFIKQAASEDSLASALNLFKTAEHAEISEVAQSLSGQFALAEVEGEKRIYHVTEQENDQGEMQEFVEHVMNEGDETIRFVAWFFDSFFDIKAKETYAMAGKTYRQPKRS